MSKRSDCADMEGDIHDPGRYRGITLMSQALKFMERILDARVRHIVEDKIGDNQLGFRKGRGTDDGLFTIRQIIEKRRERQRSEWLRKCTRRQQQW